MGAYIFYFGIPIVLSVLVLFLIVYIARKHREIKAADGDDTRFLRMIAGARKMGIIVMALPIVVVVVFVLIMAITSGGAVLGWMMVYMLPFFVIVLVARRRPLLGASLAFGASLLFIVPGIGFIIQNYESTAWYGSIMLLFAAIWLMGAWLVLKSVRRSKATNPRNRRLYD